MMYPLAYLGGTCAGGPSCSSGGRRRRPVGRWDLGPPWNVVEGAGVSAAVDARRDLAP